MSATFELEASPSTRSTAARQYTFSPAISFFVSCETQQESTSSGRSSLRAAANPSVWLAPGSVRPVVANRSECTGEDAGRQDPEKSQRVMMAMLQMDKMDIGGLQQAYEAA